MQQLSLAHLTMIDLTVPDLIAAAAAGGFDGISPRLHSTRPETVRTDLVRDGAARRDAKARLAGAGLRVPDFEGFTLMAGTKVGDFDRALDAGADLGGRWILVNSHDPEPARLAENLVAVCRAAACRSLRVGFEFMPFSAVRTVADARAVLRAAAQPNAFLTVDALHLSRSGGDPEDLAGLQAELAFVQLCDAGATAPGPDGLMAEARTGRCYPGEGALPLGRLMAQVPSGVHLSLECPVAEHTDLSPAERGRIAGRKTRAFLDGLR